MTHDNDDQTDDEEKFIYDQLLWARQEISSIEMQMRKARSTLDDAKRKLEELEQAALDYMQGNGLLSTRYFSLRKTEVVDVGDEYPDEFARVTIKREPDKRKIAELRPQANWYTIKENTHIILKGA